MESASADTGRALQQNKDGDDLEFS